MLLVPIMVEHASIAMLEIPMTALICLTLLMYFRLVDRGVWRSWGEVLTASLLCAAIVYTKQPGVFLLPALLIDMLVSHRHLLCDRRTQRCWR
ncbi:MAG: glycosyltransferase family 39 protein [Planctomycetaceae bacterium]